MRPVVLPVRDAVVSELMEEIAELRRMVETRPANGADEDMTALLQEVEELRRMVRERGLMQ